MSKNFEKKLRIHKETLSNLNSDQLETIQGGSGQMTSCLPCTESIPLIECQIPVPIRPTRRNTCANTCLYTCDDMTCRQKTCETCGGICN